MSPKRQLFKTKKRFLKKLKLISKQCLSTINKSIVWLLRKLFVTKKQRTSANAGFVLPTVAMIAIVVVLLTTVIMLRSFERAKNASNVRVNEAVISAATPAIDRGRAKLNKLFQDKRLPRATPTDQALYTVLIDKLTEYTFGDETPLKLSYTYKDKDNKDVTDTLETAWRYPVDTDNNGKFDSYTLYGVYFKTPSVGSDNKYSRARNPLEARTPPMVEGTVDATCGANTSAVLVGNTGWIKQNNELKKSFFVYTATVPITSAPSDSNYEKYQGNKGFASVEYQQDRVQIPPNNYAVVYEDDISLTPGSAFNLNGSIFTNSNFLTRPGATIRLYQVSARASCFYEAKNAKIIIGGNSAVNGFTSTTNDNTSNTSVDLFNGKSNNPSSTVWVRSVKETPQNTAYNNQAYVSRINRLVAAQFAENSDTDPSEVKDGIEKKKKSLGLSSFTTAELDKIRRQQLELYFRKRTRRVPFKEVAFNGTDASPTPLLQGSGDTLRANDAWIYPTDPTDGKTVGTDYTKLELNITGTSLAPKATELTELKKQGGKEPELGDRVLVGNNLPELWWDKTKAKFVSTGVEDTQQISDVKWDRPTGTTVVRTRRSLVQTLADVGSTDRDGEWELDAARVPGDPTDPVGGLRVVTGAGIYLKDDGTFDNTIETIWPDTSPVPGTAPTQKTIQPFWMYSNMGSTTNSIASLTYTWAEPSSNDVPRLQMRATAVYHYKSTDYNAQNPKPIACVSSYYVPTDSTRAKNINTLPDANGIQKDANGLSNNGIVYPAPTKSVSDYSTILAYQSKLKYPNGRLIDDGLLARALAKAAENRTLSEQSAIDAQICALQIKYDTAFQPVTSNPVIDHGAIRETTLLDSREVKRNSGTDDSVAPTDSYNRPVRDRQPIEIRATVLDLDLLRKKTIGGTSPSQEYLLPNSGLIYATRDDALPDTSAGTTEAAKLVSPVDFILDPTRRPNAIMLVNGDRLGRTDTYRDVEKGLILATNLPVYVKGNFNRHQDTTGSEQQEFTEKLDGSWTTAKFYTDRKTLNENFACRKSDPRLPNCTTGDQWRPATVLADAVTLLSDTFREGFRNEGDYDWSQSPLSVTPPTGFSRFNNYVTVADWPNQIQTQGSSYLNNFVTPIVLRTVPGAYLTEACIVPDGQNETTYCNQPGNWRVQINNSCNDVGQKNNNPQYLHDKIIGDTSGVTDTTTSNKIKTGFVYQTFAELDAEDKKSGNGNCFANNKVIRRIAFLRNTDGSLVTPLKVLGVAKANGNVGTVQIFDFGTDKADTGSDLMPPPNNAYVSIPWLRPTISGSNVTGFTPVLQIEQPFASPSNPNNTDRIGGASTTRQDTNRWLQPAGADTTFNLIVAAGDSPARPTEDNGGLHNFVRFMENWQPPTSITRQAIISGSFMQVKKSAYATGPYNGALGGSGTAYGVDIDSGRGTGFLPPGRQWGYDVALLSQAPDLFAQKLVLTPPELPDEYFREVSRDDKWVQTLLCAKDASDSTKFAIDQDQRPNSCKS